MMETRVYDPNQSYRYYQERHTAEQRVKELEAQLAEANEAARLQLALDRIEKAGWWANVKHNYPPDLNNFTYCVELDNYNCRTQPFIAPTLAEAAELAAKWAEAQKEAAHE